MARTEGQTRAVDRETGSIGASICAEVTVQGDVSGQLAVGSNIVQMRIDRVVGNVVNVLPPGALPSVTERPRPIRVMPRRPVPMFDRTDETSVVESELRAGRPVEVHGPSGAGKSTLLRDLAHSWPVVDACGGVAHLSARGYSRDDLLQALFEVFYSFDVPVKPGRVELRHRLQHVRAALLLDDVDLSDDEVQELEDAAPGCGFVLSGTRAHPGTGARSVALTGLPAEAAGRLLVHALGRPVTSDDQPAVDALCGLARGLPGSLLQFGASAGQFPGSLREFAAAALVSGSAPLQPDTPEDGRLIGVLAAVPGLQLDADQLAAVTGLDDVPRRLDRWLARGLVTASAPAVGAARVRTTFGLASGVQVDAAAWQLEERRAEVQAHVADWARRQPDAALTSTETVRTVHADARGRGEWTVVLSLGLVLEAAYAQTGRWDAWRTVAGASLEAARALGDAAAEAMALHQLGTHALCVGDTAASVELLRAALDLRTRLGDAAGAAATQHNLSLLVASPVPAGDDEPDAAGEDRFGLESFLEKVPMPAKVLIVLAPLAAALTFIGVVSGAPPAPQVEPQALQFATQALNRASGPRTITLGNTGGAAMHVDEPRVVGRDRDEFTVTNSTCSGEVSAGRSCTTTVVFTPVGAGDRQADLTWDVEETDDDPVSALTGAGTPLDPGSATVEPSALTFDARPLNTSSTPRRVRLVAPVSGPVELGSASIDGVQAADFLVDADGCAGARLAPGGACTATVRFSPGAEGSRSALLTFTRPDGGPVATVPLSGSGQRAPEQQLRVNPSRLDFGDEATGTSSAERRVVLTNPGTAPIAVDGAAIAGTQDFTVERVDCPTSLGPGAECSVAVVFTPTRAGQRTAQLTVASQGNPTVPLRGDGLPATPTAPEISPPLLAFGEQTVGAVSSPQAVTLTNRASVPLRLTGVSVSGATAGFRVDSSACTSGTVAADASCTMPVTFAPTVAGTHSGLLGLSVAGAASRSSVVLTGTATGPGSPVVPDVIGLERAAAERALRAATLDPGVISEAPHPDVARGSIVDQHPRAGTTLTAGGAVDLVVSTGPATTKVPKVVGEEQAVAERLLAEAKLRTGAVTQRPDPSEEPGVVVGSAPAAEAEVPVGSAVDLVVSAGPPTPAPVVVPDVVGRPLDDARRALEAVPLTVGTVTEQPDAVVLAGSVLGSTPAAGAQVPSDSAVDLVVSSGPAGPPPCTVPDLTRMSRDQAAGALDQAGLRVGQVSEEQSPTARKGTVIRTDPAAGTVVPQPCGPVNLVLSSGPPPTTEPPTTEPPSTEPPTLSEGPG